MDVDDAEPQPAEHPPHLADQPPVGADVVRPVAQPDASAPVDRHAVVRPGQVFGHRQPVEAPRHPVIEESPRHPRHGGLRHDAVRPALRLDLPQRIAPVGSPEIEVVDGHRLLKDGAVAAKRMEPRHHRRQMRHVAPPDEPRRIREPPRMLVAGRLQQQGGRVDRAAGQDHDGGLDPATLAVALDFDGLDPPAAGVREHAPRPGAGPQGDVVVRGRGADAADLGVALRAEVTRKGIARVAQDAAVRLARPPESQRQGRRVQPLLAEAGHVRRHLLRVGNRFVREGFPGGLGRVLAGRPVHLVQPFGPLVVRFERGVVDGPGRGDAVHVLQFAEVFAAQTKEDAAPELRVPADAVVGVGAERGAVVAQPRLRRLVAPLLPDGGGVPVLGFPRHEAAPFEKQDAGRGAGQGPGQGASPRARPDDDDVEPFAPHRGSDSRPVQPPPTGAAAAVSAARMRSMTRWSSMAASRLISGRRPDRTAATKSRYMA